MARRRRCHAGLVPLLDDLAVERKGDGTPVTAADRAAERLVREQLASDFPDDGILGEEEAPVASRSGRRWILDPDRRHQGVHHGRAALPHLSSRFEDEHAGSAAGGQHLPALGETVRGGPGPRLLAADHGPAR